MWYGRDEKVSAFSYEGRKKKMLTDKELELIIMEFETEFLSPEVYRYHSKYGLSVVYYIFDTEKLEKLIFEPIYLHTEDVAGLNKSEEELFKIILDNTIAIMQTKIIPYSTYLAEFESRCYDPARLELIRKIVYAIEQTEEENRLWCITSTIRERGASGSLYTPLLRRFCEEHYFKQLLIGVNNNDFAFLSHVNEELISNMQVLVSKVSHVIDDEDRIMQKKILLYDYSTDTLKEFKAESKLL